LHLDLEKNGYMDQLQSPVQGFSGIINHIQLVDLVQLSCLSQTSQTIRVEAEPGTGTIHVRAGQIVHAQARDLRGEDALFEMLQWPSGRFELVPPQEEEDETVTINKTWEFLVIEATRIRDEKALAAMAEGQLGTAASNAFMGSMDGIQLVDLVHLVCLARSDYLVEVLSQQQTGRIYAQSGQIIHAHTDGIEGETAFFEIVGWDNGRFDIDLFQGAGATTIAKPWEYLLIEAMRVLDEKAGEENEDGSKAESLTMKIQRMKVAEKIRLAMTGDRESRNLLIRDPNRMVQFAIISNPRITEPEIISIAHSKSVDDEVLKKISENREWIRLYPIRLALAKNPKTPVPIATKLVHTLTAQDLNILAKTKTVSAVVSQMARKLTQRKG